MARSIELHHCPTCGAALAKNLVESLKKDAVNYQCPNKNKKVLRRPTYSKEELDESSASFLESVNPNFDGAAA